MTADVDPIRQVFDFWRGILSNSRSQLDEKRIKAIRLRLRDGYTVEDLQLACLGCKASAFHNGENDRHRRYVSIELICRDADHVDQFIELAEREAAKEARKTSERASDGVPMPDNIRAKIETLLAKFRRTTA